MKDIKEDWLQWFLRFLIKKSTGNGVNFMPNQQLADELHKTIIKKFKRRKVYSSFKDNIWAVDLADMKLISKYNKIIRCSLCLFNIFSKNTWVVPIKEKKGVTIINAFQKILDSLKRKPNEIWVHQVSKFYNSFFKKIVRWQRHKNVFNVQ